ncbi:hypothetical protein [Limosilactobacillus reuteri]|uniref:hypothetical protein n=1 Tax=Limosilactobacillus reuteri TaxID=1598 RepID=UPI00128C3BFF|nr:hypothetical protein [Limosilactobacillus reuteri]MQB96175.1 hypothetical protein [Limosilactobacillus reuteri]
MKIKEALNFINATTTVRAKVDGDYLNIFSKDMISDNWFLKLNTKAINWDTVLKHWGGLTDVAPEDLARAMDVIQRLLDTPVEERFPEKKYQLVVKRENPFCPKYVSNIITGFDELVFDLSKDEKEARIFSEKKLNQIKEREPSLAPAIDAMKKEVKDDED